MSMAENRMWAALDGDIIHFVAAPTASKARAMVFRDYSDPSLGFFEAVSFMRTARRPELDHWIDSQEGDDPFYSSHEFLLEAGMCARCQTIPLRPRGLRCCGREDVNNVSMA